MSVFSHIISDVLLCVLLSVTYVFPYNLINSITNIYVQYYRLNFDLKFIWDELKPGLQYVHVQWCNRGTQKTYRGWLEAKHSGGKVIFECHVDIYLRYFQQLKLYRTSTQPLWFVNNRWSGEGNILGTVSVTWRYIASVRDISIWAAYRVSHCFLWRGTIQILEARSIYE